MYLHMDWPTSEPGSLWWEVKGKYEIKSQLFQNEDQWQVWKKQDIQKYSLHSAVLQWWLD